MKHYPNPQHTTVITKPTASMAHWLFTENEPCFHINEGESFLVDVNGQATELIAAQKYNFVVLTPKIVGFIMAPSVLRLSVCDLSQFLSAIGLEVDPHNLIALALNQQPNEADGMHHLAIVVTNSNTTV